MHISENSAARVHSAAAFWHDFGFTVFPIDSLTGRPLKPDIATLPRRDRDTVLADFVSYNSGTIGAVIPANVIALVSRTPYDAESLWDHLQAHGAPPFVAATLPDGGEIALFGSSPDLDPATLRDEMPPMVEIRGEGERIDLPASDYFDAAKYRASSVAELSPVPMGPLPLLAPAIQPADVSFDAPVPVPPAIVLASADPVVTSNPLERFSLRGHAHELEALAKETTPLLGNVVLSGQATIIYAPPNSGKTLLTLALTMQAIKDGRVEAGNVYYINGDDGSQGAAHKLRLFDDIGAHTLIPGYRGFAIADLVSMLKAMAATDKCRGVVVILDTVKKAVDLMDKRDSAAFGQAVRACVLRGATFIGLAHTRKNLNTAGKLVHGGTTDLLEDADAVCLLVPLDARTPEGDKVVEFQFFKRRGSNRDEAYAYADDRDASYDELLASVRLVDPEHLHRIVGEAKAQSDEQVIAAVTSCIGEGIDVKMQLADAVAKRARVSTRIAIQVIERYQGDDPVTHRWTYSVQARGAKVYRLLAT